MKTFFLVLLFLFAAILFADSIESRFAKVNTGMTMAEAKKLLGGPAVIIVGTPENIHSDGTFTTSGQMFYITWFYKEQRTKEVINLFIVIFEKTSGRVIEKRVDQMFGSLAEDKRLHRQLDSLNALIREHDRDPR